ncbi:MAG: PQQ-dependent dehydrogenase, methanol/ethanol family [Roseitalea sp.]|uniref:PQQ-dependent dehydrogenase, methanol/ethanol family n=1 Tax=Oceaniradius stylonematis TaxID=2184161 RepID=UPI000F4064E4|nr:PQQ-dependent dehydrogenase, methanol/ethanol family [Oceaniradius stylonematis]MBO6554539.1 PQQ-dependent dehydrogenase, methanol/ethanol family [Roseitalea sp.]MBO6953582.1 PQQ-dependent dehydrogenase, methanol/ethanol family [Rhizobiaceae bacterium]RNC93495.1 MAG: PQQ-dependent dehydrogenase, methanol/ethanol family [Oricola sp.]MBO6593989.1 PQQ-dependent dehydrogenase, methanol/ethanol family [Roseitalea sp.]MBO6601326.1 PQQ-dependent dehydrogenase, methanol/ethanol family [Roseitalea s
MLRYSLVGAVLMAATPALAQTITEDEVRAAVGAIDTEAIIANDAHDRNWLNYGLNYAETRYSQLDAIDTENVGELGLQWSYSLNSDRGVQSTPIVVDGVMYVTASWSIVHALDAVTGEPLWVYDPEVPGDFGKRGCCDVVNRGVAVYDGKVYVGAFDGYLHAIDAATGERVWRVDTIENRDMSYTITGAPRVINGKVIIGNGGAEFGVRGYITAYDTETGEENWRWYTVPGDPSEPFENEAMEMAAETWDPSANYWEAGGGGTVWDAMAYDPDLNLLYIGTGNGSPWNQHLRSPAGGDNLFLASIVALNPDTGEYVWHYQNTPGDTWDYTSTQHIILADLEIGGEMRQVLMQAPKNGFFYVIDRVTGEFISAEPFVETTWATAYGEDGRPIENPAARSKDEPFETVPSAYGAHNWHPMSYNPDTGLVYIPAQGVPLVQATDPNWELNSHRPMSTMSGVGWNLGYLFNVVAPEATPFGHLLAWDPVEQREVWRAEYVSPWNGGTLTTAGNLVFQGTADGRFIAYNATDGALLWQVPVTSGVVAAPNTWEHEGEQYVTIAVGWGGVYGLMQRATDRVGAGRVFTFRVGADAQMPEAEMSMRTELVSGVPYDPEHISAGLATYVSNCLFCHGVPGVNNGGAIPNLGYSDAGTLMDAEAWVLEGIGVDRGMPSFADKLTAEDVANLVAFIQGTADSLQPQ